MHGAGRDFCGLVGAPAFGTEVSLDMTGMLVLGRTVRGIVEGDSVPGSSSAAARALAARAASRSTA